jgi:hypothetical protein
VFVSYLVWFWLGNLGSYGMVRRCFAYGFSAASVMVAFEKEDIKDSPEKKIGLNSITKEMKDTRSRLVSAEQAEAI